MTNTNTNNTTTTPNQPLRIAITGANGLVGSGLVALVLASGHAVLALDRAAKGLHPESEVYHYAQVDVSDYDAYKAEVAGWKCTAMVHLAAVFNAHDDEGNFTTQVGSHIVYNTNSAMSWNTLEIAGELGINRVVLASSVNSIGMVFSKVPRFDYLPVDENHPFYPEDAYSVSKYACEIQASAFCRRYPTLRVASLRFHAVTPDELCTPSALDERVGSWKDLWGWVSVSATADACLRGLTVSEKSFPIGHEAFFIVAGTIQPQRDSLELLEGKYPELAGRLRDGESADAWANHPHVQDEHGVGAGVRGRVKNKGFISTAKAARMLGWKEVFDNSYVEA